MESDRPLRVPRRHRLSAEWLSVLSAGDGAPEITRYFWRTEWSRRLLLLDMLLDEIAEHSDALGPLPAVDTVWDLLSAAQRADPDGVAEICMDPQIGGWAAYTLRRLRGGADGDDPLWVDCGGVHGLALAVAARTGLRWSTRLPVRSGHVFVPTRGLAWFLGNHADETIEARTEDGRIWLTAAGTELLVPDDGTDVDHGTLGWWALRRVRVDAGLPFSVCLDDLAPYRDLADPVRPARLDSDAVQRWVTLIQDAWLLLCRDHRADAAAIAPGVISLVPLASEPGWGTRSASNGEAFGSVMVSEPPDPETLAVSLVHEFQHIKLGALLHLLTLTRSDDALYYAPWRDDPRPLPGLLQGVYAFLGIARFWRERRRAVTGADGRLAGFEYVYARQQTWEAAQIVRRAPGLTDNGRSLVEGLITTLDGWFSDPVDPEIVRLASLTAASHRVGWRLRHFRPDDGDVTVLAKTWMTSGSEMLVGSWERLVSPHTDLRWDQRLPAVIRRQVYTAAPIGSDDDRSVLVEAEDALIIGDLDAARAGFLTAIETDETQPAKSTDNVRAWVGLALSVDGTGDTTTHVLRERPDLVHAVHAELRPADAKCSPLRLAEWLAAT